MSIEEILSEIEKQSNISRQDLQDRIARKQNDLSGLVSLEGAAHLVAKELGIDLLDRTKRRLEMKNVIGGMKNVNVIGRIFKISNVNEFKRPDGSNGKVVNLLVGDATDYARIVLWNDQTMLVEEGAIKLGDAVQIVSGFAKENIFGGIEISLGKYGTIKPVEEDYELPSLNELNKKFLSGEPKKVSISEIGFGAVEINATIVSIFKSNFIFDVCPICGNKIDENSTCKEHGKVEPEHALVLSAIADDGRDNIRVVFFRSIAEKLLGKTANELTELDEEERFKIIKEKVLGMEIQLLGVVKKNKIVDRLELIVNNFKELNTLEECKRLIDEIELKVVN